MNTSARVALIVFAGLTLAGCVSKTAQVVPPPAKATRVASWGDQELSARDYFLKREFDDRIDKAVGIK